MAEIGLPQPEERIGIRGNPESLPVFKSHEKLNATGSVPGFVSAFNDLATTPSALGQLFSNLATSSSNKLMDKWGYELGSNPKGNLLPSITEADKRFEMAYSNQAQATLGLHANKLMMDGQLELQKAYKLTPAMIESYTQNMATGLDQILSQAPDTVKPQLHNAFSSALLRTTDQINQKMVTQQKEAYKDQMALYSATVTKNIYESAMAGNFDEAKSLLDSQKTHNAQLRSTGIISASQEAAKNQTAWQTYLTGIYTQKALEAKQEGKDAEFLAGLNNKPEVVSYLDWQSVTKNVLGNLNQFEALQQRDQTLNAIEFDLAIVEDRVTKESIDELRSKQTPENFTKSMVKYVSHLNKIKNKDRSSNELAGKWESAIAHADASPKDVNNTFSKLTVAHQQRQVNLGKPAPSDIEAKTFIAQNAGAAIPQFVKELNNMLISAHPDLMIQASNAYKILGGLKAPISTQAKAMMFGFDSQIQQGRTPEDAAQIVKENVGPKNNDELMSQDSMWNQYKKDHLASFDDEISHAKKLMDIPWFTKVPNIAAYAQRVNKAFESNLRLLNGDIEAAKAMTTHNLEQSYGLTYANGVKEYTYLPIENFMFGTGSGGNKKVTGIIQNDAALQVIKQIESTKKAFDKGHNEFYYRLVDRPQFEEAMEAKKKIDAFLSKTTLGNLPESEYIEAHKHLDDLQKIVDEYTSNKPFEIEKVWRGNHVEKFELSIQASPSIGLGINSATPVSGAYDIRLRTPNGMLQPLIGVDNLFSGQLVYRPDFTKLKNQYFALYGLSGAESDESEKGAFVARKKFQEEFGINQGINKYGEGFR